MFTDLASFLELPWPAQAMTVLAALFLVFVLKTMAGGLLVRSRHRAHFEALARSIGAPLTTRGDTRSFTMRVAERSFGIRHELRSSSGSYRGPAGDLLVIGTRLEAHRWELHQVDFDPQLVRARKLFGHNLLSSGDPAFDQRVAVREDGIPVRDGWLDRAVRDAVLRVYDLPDAQGRMWVQEQELTHISRAPWTTIDASGLRERLSRIAAVADALERTARVSGHAS